MKYQQPPDQDGDIDPGEPIPEIALLREVPPGNFTDRIRHSVQRRIFAAETLDFSLVAIFQAFWEYLALTVSLLADTRKGKGRSQ